MSDDPYEILDIDRDASDDEIAAAYKRWAKQTHPDSGGSAKEFLRVKMASMVLLDPVKRARFDRDGIIDQNNPDTTVSKAMERVTGFFINSIEAIAENNMDLNELDLVSGGKEFFRQKIGESKTQIRSINMKISQYEKVLRRIKTKRSNDVLSTMIRNHMSNMKAAILFNESEIEMLTTAIALLDDYEFTKEARSPYRGLIV